MIFLVSNKYMFIFSIILLFEIFIKIFIFLIFNFFNVLRHRKNSFAKVLKKIQLDMYRSEYKFC